MLSGNHLAVNKWTAKVNVLLLVALLSLSFLGIHGQLDSLGGFVSIDCGYTDSPTYQDSKTGLWYVADEGFTDAGLIHPVNMGNLQPDLALRYANVRYFPNGNGPRNCYTLRSLKPGGKYYVRAVFGYGNYDRLNSPPTFDLYVGANYWTTVRIVNGSRAYVFDTIAVLSSSSGADYLQVCLVNKGSGNPFISGLDLRPLHPELYPDSSEAQSLVLLSFFRDDTVGFGPNRYHFGIDYQHIRYPDDPYDRIWQRYQNVSTWTVPGSASGVVVKNPPYDTYDVPSAVMLSASTPLNASATMEIVWSSDLSMDVDADTNLLLLLYFAEVEANASRQFDVLLDSNVTLAAAFSPSYLLTTVVRGSARGPGPHSISLVPTSSSKLPPVISAMEIYLVRPRNESATRSADATAVMSVQKNYSVKKNWEGDPCSPAAFAWDGLNCSYSPPGPQRIIALYLPSSGLIGEIDPSFGQLTLLQNLNLSHNNLSGPIPDFLGRVPSLILLDLSSNNLSGSIPNSLLQKSQEGLLTLRVDNNPYLCVNDTCNSSPNRKKTKLALGLGLGVPVVILVAAVAVWFLIKRTDSKAPIPQFGPSGEAPQEAVRGGQAAQAMENDQDPPQTVWEDHADMPDGQQQDPVGDSSRHGPEPVEDDHATHLPTVPQRFSYEDLKRITDDFKKKIGEGGFGPVFFGKLSDGTPVAVKMRMRPPGAWSSSSHGDNQFSAEVEHLGRSHDKNVVSLLGCCEDKEHLGLVYEYMKGGNLEDQLKKGALGEEVPLTWSQRLKIALHSANGLHYLHSAFNTPVIHRDVKAANILLTEKLVAKISDFGLARAISSEAKTHTVTNTVIGTSGYMDPEYLKAGELRGKTDVYSFGIVLLQLITARPASAVVGDNRRINIADWVRETLSKEVHGDISSVIDHSIRGHCDLVSVRKVAELALRCAERDVHARPTMTEVVAELEALQQQQRDDGASSATGTSGSSAMAEDDEAAVAGAHEVVPLAEAQ